MSRKDAILSMRQVLVKRRDALRKALAGDLSLLKEMKAQTSGDMVVIVPPWIPFRTRNQFPIGRGSKKP